MNRAAIAVALAALTPFVSAQVEPPVGKKGAEVTLVDSDIPKFAGFRPRINSMRVPPDGTNRRFLVRMTGELYCVEPDATVHDYLNVKTTVGAAFADNGDIARGFTAIEFHPQFATNGLFYTVHTENPTTTPGQAPLFRTQSALAGDPVPDPNRVQHCVLTEWHAPNPAANTFTGTRRELMRVETEGWWHPMGEIRFNPLAAPGDDDDGLLYIAQGDGQSYTLGRGGADPNLTSNLQRLDSYLGVILRIDPLGNNGPTGLYGIPATNPWANDGDPDTYGEIFAYGFRNPHRFGWDPATGACFVYDVGEANIEEINILHPGANYGWPEREGTFLLGAVALPPDVLDGTTDDGFTYPVLQWDHVDGRATAGGEACRGCGVPELEGTLVTGNMPSGKLFFAPVADLIAADDGVPATCVVPDEAQLVYQNQRLTGVELMQLSDPNDYRVDLRFALDADNRLYYMNKRDGVMRFIGPGPCRADVTTTNTNPGDAGYRAPDGTVDGADLSVFVEAWLDLDPLADTTTDNVNPGEIGWGVPNGSVTGADLSWFVEAWLAGCL